MSDSLTGWVHGGPWHWNQNPAWELTREELEAYCWSVRCGHSKEEQRQRLGEPYITKREKANRILQEAGLIQYDFSGGIWVAVPGTQLGFPPISRAELNRRAEMFLYDHIEKKCEATVAHHRAEQGEDLVEALVHLKAIRREERAIRAMIEYLRRGDGNA